MLQSLRPFARRPRCRRRTDRPSDFRRAAQRLFPLAVRFVPGQSRSIRRAAAKARWERGTPVREMQRRRLRGAGKTDERQPEQRLKVRWENGAQRQKRVGRGAQRSERCSGSDCAAREKRMSGSQSSGKSALGERRAAAKYVGGECVCRGQPAVICRSRATRPPISPSEYHRHRRRRSGRRPGARPRAGNRRCGTPVPRAD